MSDAEREAAANLEDSLLAAEHDASHAQYTSLFGYGWFAVLVYLVWEGYISFDRDKWLYQPEVQLILGAAAVITPIFLGYTLWQIIEWRHKFGDLSPTEPRVNAARTKLSSAGRHLVAACTMYVVMVLVPLVFLYLNIRLPNTRPN